MFDWIPLIGDWSFGWQALVLSVLIPVVCLPILFRFSNKIRWKLGLRQDESRVLNITIPALTLITMLTSLILYSASIVSGIVIPSFSLPIHWEVLSLAFAGALLLLPPFFIFGLEEDHKVFSVLFSRHYRFLFRTFETISISVILAFLVLVFFSIVFGSVAIVSVIFGLSDMGVVTLFAIGLFSMILAIMAVFGM